MLEVSTDGGTNWVDVGAANIVSGGYNGVIVCDASGVGRAPAFPVTAVDTTAAGDAFTKVVTDPAVVEEAKKRKLDIEPASGEELQTLAKEVITQPPAVVERVKKVLGEEK